jgi:hypothetical protein
MDRIGRVQLMWNEILITISFVGIAAVLWFYRENVDPRLMFLSSIILLLLSSVAMGLAFVMVASAAMMISYYLLLLGLLVFVTRKGDVKGERFGSAITHADLVLEWIGKKVDHRIVFLLSIIFVIISSIALVMANVRIANMAAIIVYYILLIGMLLIMADFMGPRLLKMIKRT